MQGNVLRLQMRYDTAKVTEIKVKLYGSDGKVAVDAVHIKSDRAGTLA